MAIGLDHLLSDKEFVNDLRSLNPDALSLYFQAVRPRLLRFSELVYPYDPESVLQDLFLRESIYEGLKNEQPVHWESYLRRRLTFRAGELFKFWKAAKRKGSQGVLGGEDQTSKAYELARIQVDQGDLPDDQLVKKEEASVLFNCLSELKELQAHILWLYFYCEMTRSEIAEELNRTCNEDSQMPRKDWNERKVGYQLELVIDQMRTSAKSQPTELNETTDLHERLFESAMEAKLVPANADIKVWLVASNNVFDGKPPMAFANPIMFDEGMERIATAREGVLE